MKKRGLAIGVLIILSVLFISATNKLETTVEAVDIKVKTNNLPDPIPLVIENDNEARELAFNKNSSEKESEEVVETVSQPVVEDLSMYNDILPTRNESVIDLTNNIAPLYGLDPKLIQSIIFYESSNNPQAYNGLCTGLMQVSYEWHQDRMVKLGVDDLYDPYENILVGTDYLSELIQRYGDVSLALMIYNGDSRANDLYSQGDMSTYARNILTLQQRINEYESKGGQ